jgi:hypothetical protein
MHFINLNMLSDFMEVLNNISNQPTKNKYFPMHISIYYHLFIVGA